MASSEAPMYMEFGFRINGKSGKYILEMNETQIIHEHLEYVLAKNKGVYFEITSEKISISTKIFLERVAYQEIKLACTKYWGKHSLLSILMHEASDKADEYIKNKLSKNFNLIIDFLSKISCKVKFGSCQERGIIGLPHEILDKTEDMLNAFFQHIYRDINAVHYKQSKKENSIHYQLMQKKMIAGYERDIEFAMESTGTQSLLQLLPFMLVVVKGSVSIIDEFDTGVHDLLVKNIVQSLYKNLSGQLIMTTHNTLLMEANIPKECIYVINELEQGNKEIQCITYYDNKIHANTSIRNQYMHGTYHGIPELSDIDFVNFLNILGISKKTQEIER